MKVLRWMLAGTVLGACGSSIDLVSSNDGGAQAQPDAVTAQPFDASSARDASTPISPDGAPGEPDGACPFTCPFQGECTCLKDARGCDARVMKCTPLAANACGTAQVVLCPGNIGVCDFAGVCDPLRSDCLDVFCAPLQPSDAGGVVPDADPAGCPSYCPVNCTCLQDSAGCNRQGRCDGAPCGPRIVLCAESYVCDFDASCDLQTSDCREFCTS